MTPALVVAAMTLAVDQATKLWAARRLRPCADRDCFGLEFFVHRFKDSHWLRQAATPPLYGMFLLTMVDQIRFVSHSSVGSVANGLLLGAGLSHAGELLWRGGIVDFLRVGIPLGNYRVGGVTNLADVALVVGIVGYYGGW